MAKPKTPATETEALDGATLVTETVHDYNFAQPALEADTGPRGPSLQEDIEAIRTRRAAERKAKGPVTRKRRVTNYHDAERLFALYNAGHTSVCTPEEIVDWEEAGLLPNPEHYATGTSAERAAQAKQGQISPPAKGEPA